MSARRFRHRDRQQARPGSPQLGPGLGAHRPACRIRSIRHYAPPHTAARRFGLPAAYVSGISDTAHHGHRVPDIRRTPDTGVRHFGHQISCAPDIRPSPDTGVRHTGLPAAYTSEIKYPVFPTSGAAGRLASGIKKSDMKKGNPVSDSPSDAPCCARIPGGGAISSRAGRSTRASTYRP